MPNKNRSQSTLTNPDFGTMTFPKFAHWKNKNIPWKWVDVEELHALLSVGEKMKFRRLFAKYYPN